MDASLRGKWHAALLYAHMIAHVRYMMIYVLYICIYTYNTCVYDDCMGATYAYIYIYIYMYISYIYIYTYHIISYIYIFIYMYNEFPYLDRGPLVQGMRGCERWCLRTAEKSGDLTSSNGD